METTISGVSVDADAVVEWPSGAHQPQLRGKIAERGGAIGRHHVVIDRRAKAPEIEHGRGRQQRDQRGPRPRRIFFRSAPHAPDSRWRRALGFEVIAKGPDGMRKRIVTEVQRYKDIIAKAGIERV